MISMECYWNLKGCFRAKTRETFDNFLSQEVSKGSWRWWTPSDHFSSLLPEQEQAYVRKPQTGLRFLASTEWRPMYYYKGWPSSLLLTVGIKQVLLFMSRSRPDGLDPSGLHCASEHTDGLGKGWLWAKLSYLSQNWSPDLSDPKSSSECTFSLSHPIHQPSPTPHVLLCLTLNRGLALLT